MQRWTCTKCERSYTTDVMRLPVRCRCGEVDRDGRGVTDASGEPVPIVPSTSKVQRFTKAVSRWIAAGKPERTDEQVDAILRDHCSMCELFKDSRCTHRDCGCQVRSSAGEKIPLIGWLLPRGMLNKLRMATERCPAGKWEAEDTAESLRPSHE